MSREQANTFQKYRDASDAQGDLGWALRLQQKALRAGPEALARLDVEREFELSDDEKIIWRVLKLPRKYPDLETCGLFPIEKMRAVLRGLVAADVVDIIDGAQAKALLPAELKRLKAELAGKEVQKPREPLRARVYRPDISGEPPPGAVPGGAESEPPSDLSSPSAWETTSGSFRVPSGAFRPSGPAAAPVSLTDEEKAFRDATLHAHAAMSKQTHYEFLGVAKGADDAAVRQAYVRLARDYHPDRAAAGGLGSDEAFKRKIDELFKRLGEAHQRLGSADGRASYDRELEALSRGGGATTADGKKRRPQEAQNAFKMAETFFKKKDYKQAEAHYRQAVLFDGEDPKILTGLAWCIWTNPDVEEKARTEDARKRLAEIVQKHKHADAAYKLGLLLRRLEDESNAQKSFALAHKFDPSHVDAQREVRLAGMRREKTEQEQKSAASFFSKLLKK